MQVAALILICAASVAEATHDEPISMDAADVQLEANSKDKSTEQLSTIDGLLTTVHKRVGDASLLEGIPAEHFKEISDATGWHQVCDHEACTSKMEGCGRARGILDDGGAVVLRVSGKTASSMMTYMHELIAPTGNLVENLEEWLREEKDRPGMSETDQKREEVKRIVNVNQFLADASQRMNGREADRLKTIVEALNRSNPPFSVWVLYKMEKDFTLNDANNKVRGGYTKNFMVVAFKWEVADRKMGSLNEERTTAGLDGAVGVFDHFEQMLKPRGCLSEKGGPQFRIYKGPTNEEEYVQDGKLLMQQMYPLLWGDASKYLREEELRQMAKAMSDLYKLILRLQDIGPDEELESEDKDLKVAKTVKAESLSDRFGGGYVGIRLRTAIFKGAELNNDYMFTIDRFLEQHDPATMSQMGDAKQAAADRKARREAAQLAENEFKSRRSELVANHSTGSFTRDGEGGDFSITGVFTRDGTDTGLSMQMMLLLFRDAVDQGGWACFRTDGGDADVTYRLVYADQDDTFVQKFNKLKADAPMPITLANKRQLEQDPDFMAKMNDFSKEARDEYDRMNHKLMHATEGETQTLCAHAVQAPVYDLEDLTYSRPAVQYFTTSLQRSAELTDTKAVMEQVSTPIKMWLYNHGVVKSNGPARNVVPDDVSPEGKYIGAGIDYAVIMGKFHIKVG